MKFGLLIVLLSLSAAGPWVLAQNNTAAFRLSDGRDFLALCGQISTAPAGSDYEGVTGVACAAYFSGAMDGIYTALAERGVPSLAAAGICMPPSVTTLDLMHSTAQFIRTDPSFLDAKVGILIYRNLLASYPCR